MRIRFAAIALLAGLLFFLSLLLGSVYVSPAEVWQSLTGGEAPLLSQKIVTAVRLPRALTAALGGGGLAVAGLLMQTLFRNPLAGPSVLGLSSGASLAVAVTAMGGTGLVFGYYTQTIAAVIGSTAVLLIILAVARRFADVTVVLIVGLMLSFFTSAVVGLLQSVADESSLKAFVYWGFGSFAGVGTAQMPVFAGPVIAGILLSALLIKPLNALLPGEMHAKSMGVNTGRLRLAVMGITGVVTGVVTAFCGPVAFIGLAAPHFARMTFGSVNHGIILPASMGIGAVLGLLCDLIARRPFADTGIPLNTVCAFMGAPVVIYLIFAGRRKKWLI